MLLAKGAEGAPTTQDEKNKGGNRRHLEEMAGPCYGARSWKLSNLRVPPEARKL